MRIAERLENIGLELFRPQGIWHTVTQERLRHPSWEQPRSIYLGNERGFQFKFCRRDKTSIEGARLRHGAINANQCHRNLHNRRRACKESLVKAVLWAAIELPQCDVANKIGTQYREFGANIIAFLAWTDIEIDCRWFRERDRDWEQASRMISTLYNWKKVPEGVSWEPAIRYQGWIAHFASSERGMSITVCARSSPSVSSRVSDFMNMTLLLARPFLIAERSSLICRRYCIPLRRIAWSHWDLHGNLLSHDSLSAWHCIDAGPCATIRAIWRQ